MTEEPAADRHGLELTPRALEHFRRGKRAAIMRAVDDLAPELYLLKRGKLILALEGNRVRYSEIYHYRQHTTTE